MDRGAVGIGVRLLRPRSAILYNSRANGRLFMSVRATLGRSRWTFGTSPQNLLQLRRRLEKRLWDAADQFRANSGLKSQEYLRFAEVRFVAQRLRLEGTAASKRSPVSSYPSPHEVTLPS